MTDLDENTGTTLSLSLPGDEETTIDRGDVSCVCRTKCKIGHRRGKTLCSCKEAGLPCTILCRCSPTVCENRRVGPRNDGRRNGRGEERGVSAMPPRDPIPSEEEVDEYVSGLDIDQLQAVVKNFVRRGSGFLHIARFFSDGLVEEPGGDHPFGSPPNPDAPDWCKCGRCSHMPTARENLCCGEFPCKTMAGEFRAVVLDCNVLQVSIRYRADWMGDRPNYGPSGYRKAAYRQYIIATYGYLGRGIRRVAPSCVVRCIRRWYPSHDGTYMGYLSD